MILADKIINERKKNGWSQEELADMLDVSRQSVSKWEGAQSVPDLQKILKMAEIFSVSTDYLLKDELEPEDAPLRSYEVDDVSRTKRKVTMEDAREYILLRKQLLPRIALGVFLCITCPVVLILLAGLQSAGIVSITENMAAAIGLIFIFGQVGMAVFIFIINSGKLSKYNFLEQECFETEYGVDGMVKEKMALFEKTNTLALTVGVMLCMLSCVPLVICSVMGVSEYIITAMVCLLLIAVATAVFLFISVCGFYSSFKILLQCDDYTLKNKKLNKRMDAISGVYWMLITAVYLAVSFLTMRWDRTWIIWAVSGVVYALLRAIVNAFDKGE
ncbi:MAG: helix-turn-helix domain-containing protein [Lachnospiraceae bacterium]|nr:helix-turn-helix domain-containing protein [Lachnospiraceae bacterium]